MDVSGAAESPAPAGDDPFDRLGAAASRVLRAAMEGSAALRSHHEDVEAALRALEASVGRILREAEAAAASILAEARRQAADVSGSAVEGPERQVPTRRPAADVPRLSDEDRIVLRRRPSNQPPGKR